ncbi:MAG: hypothetical protein F4X18_08225 [Acidimicrobiia bacterium]|nr:hypothetical protein [Acidimicrobiia bacterium]
MAQLEYDPWDSHSPGSRFNHRVEFVIGVGDFGSVVEGEEEVEWEVGYRHFSDRVTTDLTEAIPSLPVETFDTSFGRGAEADALGIAVDVLSAPGGIAATVLLVKKVYDQLVASNNAPTVSLGTAKYICLADLLQFDATLDPNNVRAVIVTEASPPGQPSETNHTGLDMFTVLFIDSENTRSWLYLIDCDGKILHRSEGSAIPEWILWYMGMEPPEG